MIEKYSTYLAQQFEHPWEKIPEKAFSPEENSELLILHDTTDKFVAHDDADTIHRLWPRSTLIKTSGNTHRNIIWSSEVTDRVANFIQV